MPQGRYVTSMLTLLICDLTLVLCAHTSMSMNVHQHLSYFVERNTPFLVDVANLSNEISWLHVM